MEKMPRDEGRTVEGPHWTTALSLCRPCGGRAKVNAEGQSVRRKCMRKGGAGQNEIGLKKVCVFPNKVAVAHAVSVSKVSFCPVCRRPSVRRQPRMDTNL